MSGKGDSPSSPAPPQPPTLTPGFLPVSPIPLLPGGQPWGSQLSVLLGRGLGTKSWDPRRLPGFRVPEPRGAGRTHVCDKASHREQAAPLGRGSGAMGDRERSVGEETARLGLSPKKSDSW